MAISSNLPSLADRPRQACPKGPTRRETKIAKQAEARAHDREAREAAWKACRGICPRCHKPMKRGGGLLIGAEFNHTTSPSQGGRKVHVGEWMHHHCHMSGPSGGHVRTR